MLTFKHLLHIAWPTFLALVGTVIGTIGIIYVISSSQSRHEKSMKSAPCIDFNEKPIQEVPARCFAYFTEHK
jgi:hypothetical protein